MPARLREFRQAVRQPLEGVLEPIHAENALQHTRLHVNRTPLCALAFPPRLVGFDVAGCDVAQQTRPEGWQQVLEGLSVDAERTRTGARIRGNGRADCPRCKRQRAVSFDESRGIHYCHGAGCDFSGGSVKLAREQGLTTA